MEIEEGSGYKWGRKIMAIPINLEWRGHVKESYVTASDFRSQVNEWTCEDQTHITAVTSSEISVVNEGGQEARDGFGRQASRYLCRQCSTKVKLIYMSIHDWQVCLPYGSRNHWPLSPVPAMLSSLSSTSCPSERARPALPRRIDRFHPKSSIVHLPSVPKDISQVLQPRNICVMLSLPLVSLDKRSMFHD
jgi:hypothetical protein